MGAPDEVAFEMGWIDAAALSARAAVFGKTEYGAYLARRAGAGAGAGMGRATDG